MKQTINNIATSIRDWRRLAGYSNRNIINKLSGHPIAVIEYSLDISAEYSLKGKKILFFSDLHFGSGNFDVDEFRKMVTEISPDWILFGGDLITYACYQDEAFEFLKEIVCDVPDAAKIAVYGNWDRRRNRWYPNSRWADAYGEVGFQLLINERVIVDGINFYGMDEPRIGKPELNSALLSVDKFNCIISHSVDPVVDALGDVRGKGQSLFLCGHSHGGQIRMPFFGAVLTSTKYWKLFEYGHYHSQRKESDLIMTSGIGTTRLPFRIFCEPEVVVVRFV
jgi:predicted MPP superfamily phosphohydrolase